jgi:hypothetical protein
MRKVPRPGGTPGRRFTTGLKAGALRRILVARRAHRAPALKPGKGGHGPGTGIR